MPLADQIVQVGHACLEAGRRFAQPAEPCHLVLLSVQSVRHLHDAVARAEEAGIRCVVFSEPDDDLSDTAACTEPVLAGGRRLFRRFPLWRSPDGDARARGPPKCPLAECKAGVPHVLRSGSMAAGPQGINVSALCYSGSADDRQ